MGPLVATTLVSCCKAVRADVVFHTLRTPYSELRGDVATTRVTGVLVLLAACEEEICARGWVPFFRDSQDRISNYSFWHDSKSADLQQRITAGVYLS